MRVLVACERSGHVREAFREAGHDAVSCDIVPADDGSPHHIAGDALEAISRGGWDLLIAFPPCTYLASSGLHWNKRDPERAEKTAAALEFARAMLYAPVPRIAVENPVGRIGTAIRPADQYLQPHAYGADASKRTGLWLHNLPPLRGTLYVEPRTTDEGDSRWANQTDSGQNRLGPSEDRAKLRSETFPGVARAMASQWGSLWWERPGQAIRPPVAPTDPTTADEPGPLVSLLEPASAQRT